MCSEGIAVVCQHGINGSVIDSAVGRIGARCVISRLERKASSIWCCPEKQLEDSRYLAINESDCVLIGLLGISQLV